MEVSKESGGSAVVESPTHGTFGLLEIGATVEHHAVETEEGPHHLEER